ncbi:uncharacterized protein [Nicotiana tomentosiformis]|uniref:uncharacterized protein n=1 Tax=Nicotiana tomentosiformis TaxID=4098 RepID=UPI00388C63FC
MKQLACKPKNASARELSSDILHRLRDEPEEEEDSELVSRVRSGSKLPQAMEVVEEAVVEVSEPGRVETILPRAREVKKETVIGTSRSEDSVPKEALGMIVLYGSPSFTNSMINEAQTLRGNLGEGAQGVADSFHHFFDGLDSTASEDVTELGDIPSSVLHHETFLRYREEFKCHKAETRELFEKKDAYKLLNTLANDPNSQVQKRLDQIGQLQVEVDTVNAEAEEWKKNMDRLASKKETAQLALAEAQLRTVKEKNLVQAKTIEGLQSHMNSVVSGEENMAKELEAAKSEVVVAKIEADDKVAQVKAVVEAIQELAKNMVKHARWQSRREALEGVHAQNFDILAEIENAKTYKAKAQKLAYPEEDSGGSEESGEFDGGEDPIGDDVAHDED